MKQHEMKGKAGERKYCGNGYPAIFPNSSIECIVRPFGFVLTTSGNSVLYLLALLLHTMVGVGDEFKDRATGG